MFEYDIVKASSIAGLKSKQEAYLAFLLTVKLSKKQYPYSLDSVNLYKGIPVRFTITSWGGYYDADNKWRVFIAYRSNEPKHTIQHSWYWDGENEEPFGHKVMEFIN